jgi:hypothetical protein
LVAIFQNRFVKWVLAPVAVFGALGWAYFQYEYPTCTFRYKLTAEVMTPEGLKTGSSVIEVSYQRGGDFGGGPHANVSLIGEAVYIDLGQGKNLFVTMTTTASGREIPFFRSYNGYDFTASKGAMNPFMIPLNVFHLIWRYGEERELCRTLSLIPNDVDQEVVLTNLPTLLSFWDRHDPNAKSVVEPTNIAKTFGAGYTLTRVLIVPTREPFSPQIEKVLDWLPEQKTQLTNSGNQQFLHAPLNYDAFIAPGIKGDGGASL